MVKKSVLNNGIRVITEFMPSTLSATIGIWVDHGSRGETSSVNGISHFIEHLLFKGTPTRSALQIAHEIDSVGGVLNAFTSKEYVCYYVKVLHRYQERALNLLADIFQHSLFDPDEIEKERSVVLQEIRMLEDTPDDRIHELFTRTLWLDHPLGAPIIGTEENVSSLTRDDICRHWQNSYRPQNVIITAAGNLDHDTVVKSVSQLFVDLSDGSYPEKVLSLPTVEKRCKFVEKDLEQLHVCLGLPALPQAHPDRYAVLLLNTMLGGSMSSRLFQEIREKRGLAYSIYSYLSLLDDVGALIVYAGTGKDQGSEVVALILDELGKFRRSAIPDHELASAQEQLKGNILLSLESSDNRMSKLAKNEIYHGCYLPLTEIEQGLSAVTTDSLAEVAERLIDESKLNLVALGPTTPDLQYDRILTF